MQGLILAAGMGIRLKEHCREKTKAMIEINGEKLIDSQIMWIFKTWWYYINRIRFNIWQLFNRANGAR